MKSLLTLLLSFFIITTPTTQNDDATILSGKKLKKFEKTYAYIPSGTLVLDNKKASVQSFYMMKTEVSNLHYQEFLAYIKNNSDQSLLEKIQLHPEQFHAKPYEKTYLDHPAYHNFPVLTVSYEAAKEYCKWLGNMLAKNYEINKEKILVRLPTKHEWMYAAHGGHSQSTYPWGGNYLRNSKGCLLANFNKSLSTENITFDPETQEYKIVESKINQSVLGPVPVNAYLENEFGLYNMSGNAAEMIDTKGKAVGGSWNSPGYDIRIQSEMSYEESSSFVGFRPVVQFID